MRKAREKGLFEGGFSARTGRERLVFEAKTEFFRRFSEAKSYDVGYFGVGKFSTGIDSREFRNNLQDFKGNLYPPGVEGGWVPVVSGQGSVDRGQWSGKAHGGGDRLDGGWTYGHSAPPDRNYLQGLTVQVEAFGRRNWRRLQEWLVVIFYPTPYRSRTIASTLSRIAVCVSLSNTGNNFNSLTEIARLAGRSP